MWYYRKANTDQIRKVTSQFNWEKSFCNNGIDSMICLFNKTVKNFLANYIPHDSIICDDRDTPWLN